MHDVRSAVDAVDQEIVALLAKRFSYMTAAARIKSNRDAVRDEARKAQVIENARDAAKLAGIPEDAIGEIWEILVESSIAFELKTWDATKP
jgi:isochorismate pyruvate lyase